MVRRGQGRPALTLAEGTVLSQAGGRIDFPLSWIGRVLGDSERRQVCVLACEMVPRNGTRGAVAGDTTEDLLAFRQLVDAKVKRLGGVIARFSGSRALAFWGVPRQNAEDARSTAIAALEIAEQRGDLPIRCALDAGIVVASLHRDGTSRLPDFVGSVPEQALRLLSFAAIGGVVAGHALQRLAARGCLFIPMPPIQCEAGETQAWQVERSPFNIGPTAMPARRLAGRDGETAALADVWQRTANGGSASAIVTGRAGIGKSAVLADLRMRVIRCGGIWIETSCAPESAAVPLHLLRQLLAATAPWFSSSAPAGRRGAEAIAEQLAAALPEGTRLGPIVLAIEDVHWGDEASLAGISHLARRIATLSRVLLVLTGRTTPSAISGSPEFLQLDLQPLSRRSVMDLVGTIGTQAVDHTKASAIADLAQGIPLFAIELARLNHVHQASPDLARRHFEGTSTLTATLGARLDSLGDLKVLAQAASVLGSRIETDVLAKMLEIDALALPPLLEELVTHHILERMPDHGTAVYRFSHALMREAAGATLVTAKRRQLHLRAADVLVGDACAGRVPDETSVALHFARAEAHADAVVWWQRAAERAIRLGTPEAAVSHLRCALEQNAALALADRRTQTASAQDHCDLRVKEIELLALLGPQLTQLRASAAPVVIAIYERAIELDACQGTQGTQWRFDLLWGLLGCLLVRGDVTRALPVAAQLRATAAGGGEREMLALRISAVAMMLSGATGEAIALYRRVLEGYAEPSHAHLRFTHVSDQGALALAHLAWAEAYAGLQLDSERHQNEVLILVQRLAHPHTSAHVLSVLASAADVRGDPGTAKTLARTGRAMSLRHNFPYWSAWCELVEGGQIALDDPETGEKMLSRALEAYRKTGAEQARPLGLMRYAAALRRLGRKQEAAVALAEAAGLVKRYGLGLFRPELDRQARELDAASRAPDDRQAGSHEPCRKIESSMSNS